MRRIFGVALAALFCFAPLTASADRVITYPGQNPTSAGMNQQPRFTRLALGTWMRDAMGPNLSAGGTYANLSVVPGTGLNVVVQPSSANTLGSLYQIAADDANPLPATGQQALPADPTLIVVQALQPGAVTVGPITAPLGGNSQYYLLEAQVRTTDTTPQSLLFVSSLGIRTSQSVNVYRQDQIVYQLKPGVASAGPTIPTVDAGWIAVANILVPSGASSITSGMITAAPPFGGFVTSVSASGNLSSTGGTTPQVSMTASPTFTNVIAQSVQSSVTVPSSGKIDATGGTINATAANSAAGSGYTGPVVVAQATAQPTPQPGNPYVNNYIMGDGIGSGLWELCKNCQTLDGAFNQGHYHVLWVTNPGNATGGGDIALGGCAMCSGDAGGINLAVGVGAMENNSTFVPLTGNSNVGIGNDAMSKLISGSGNIAIGHSAGQCITSGSSNLILGDGWSDQTAGCQNSGSYNVMLGPEAGLSAAEALHNAILIGQNAGQLASSPSVIAIGLGAGQFAAGTNGDAVLIGNGAGKGVAGGSNADRSVLIGGGAATNVTTGQQNVGLGFHSLYGLTAGNLNAGVGYQSLSALTTGASNTAIGAVSCGGLTTGNWDVCIGNNATVPSATGNGQLSIVNAIYGIGNNTSGTGISTGCIVLYTTETTCPTGTKLDVALGGIRAPSGSATSCTGGHTFDNGLMVISGAGAPTCTAPAASLYLRSDGASGSHIYISQGSGTWSAIPGV